MVWSGPGRSGQTQAELELRHQAQSANGAWGGGTGLASGTRARAWGAWSPGHAGVNPCNRAVLECKDDHTVWEELKEVEHSTGNQLEDGLGVRA